jgi:hypothetical protein
MMPSKRRWQKLLQGQLPDVHNSAEGGETIRSGSLPQATCVVLVVAVTKVMIRSILFSFKEEHDHKRRK